MTKTVIDASSEKRTGYRKWSLLARLYSVFMRSFVQRVLIPRFASSERVRDGRNQWAFLSEQTGINPAGLNQSQSEAHRIWWHAASVGELEILWPIMVRIAEEAAQEREPGQDSSKSAVEFVVTILSESAKERLEKLNTALSKLGMPVVFSGYCPWEGDWTAALSVLEPDLFITSKYEAWPELWMGLEERQIPLLIVSAKDRRSLRLCRGICRALGAALPDMSLFAAISEDLPGLKKNFPQARVEMVGEPRWDQVWNRAQAGSPRAKELAAAMQELPRPWGVLGSAWSEDVGLWNGYLQKVARAPAYSSAHTSDQALIDSLGSVLIVPHRIDSEHVQEIEDVLKKGNVEFVRTSDFKSAQELREALKRHSAVRCLIVNEMGFLSELYSVADWAYVGGGIGRRGVHSTIEPAIHGIPISCGTYRAHQFVEIAELRSTGQMTLIRSEAELEHWVNGLKSASQNRDRWRAEAMRRLGATERLSQRVLGMLH
ncbi:MAG: 3-deoxy-D-manno-octulosonic acid transferase [Bdellovibrionia bacterium]